MAILNVGFYLKMIYVCVLPISTGQFCLFPAWLYTLHLHVTVWMMPHFFLEQIAYFQFSMYLLNVKSVPPELNISYTPIFVGYTHHFKS